jgi:chitosanase
MALDSNKTRKIWSIINCIETGTPYFDYSSITILPDGPNNIRQVTLSVGFTEYGSNLKKVVQRYVDKKGKYANRFVPYLNRIGKMPSLVTDKNFVDALVTSSKNDKLMRDAQDEIFEQVYFEPALKWAAKEGIETPLGILVVYDSHLHSGGVFTFLRNKFSEKTPTHGGDEKKWISDYLISRDSWLSNHSNKSVRSSAYRTKTYIKLANRNNWDLIGPINTLNGCAVL